MNSLTFGESQQAAEEELAKLSASYAQEKTALHNENKAFHRVMEELHGVADMESWSAIKDKICTDGQDFRPARFRQVA